MFVLPTSIAPASRSSRTTVAVSEGVYAKPGQPAVVGTPATSMLSFTANGIPYSGSDGSASSSLAALARSSSSQMREIHTGASTAPARAMTSRATSDGVRRPAR